MPDPVLLLQSLASSLDAGVPARVALATFARPDAAVAAAAVGRGAALEAALVEARVLRAGGAEAALVRAGERTGDLPGALRLVAADLEATRAHLRGLAAACAYPVFLLLAANFILPFPDLVLDGPGAYFGKVAPRLLWAGAPLAALVYLLRSGRLTWGALLRPTRRLPGLRSVHRHHAAARFCQVLGRSLASGLPIDDTLALAGASLPYPDQRAAVDATRASVRSGAPLAAACATSLHPHILPPDTLSVLTAAERAGTLPTALAERAATHAAGATTGVRMAAGAASTVITLVVMILLATAILERYAALLPGMGGLGGAGGEELPSELREMLR